MEEEVIAGIRELLEAAKTRGLTDEDIENYLKINGYYLTSWTDKKTDEVILEGQANSCYKKTLSVLHFVIFKLLPTLMMLTILAYPLPNMANGSACLVTHISPFGDLVTPLANCDMCRGVTEAPRLTNLSREDFLMNYAYTSRPILVEGAVLNWSALEVFSYEYFKSLYLSIPETLEEDNFRGQFFSYNSNIRGLKELFSLPAEVASMQAERWYIGWSCDEERIGESLKEHVDVPYFIPPSLSDLTLSWIFMGSPGPGANLHIDVVDLPSWQAQLRGKKTWSLVPPPECQDVCHNFNVTMNTGDVLVIDTNKWFHQTYIHPGSISITIGSEYY